MYRVCAKRCVIVPNIVLTHKMSSPPTLAAEFLLLSPRITSTLPASKRKDRQDVVVVKVLRGVHTDST